MRNEINHNTDPLKICMYTCTYDHVLIRTFSFALKQSLCCNRSKYTESNGANYHFAKHARRAESVTNLGGRLLGGFCAHSKQSNERVTHILLLGSKPKRNFFFFFCSFQVSSAKTVHIWRKWIRTKTEKRSPAVAFLTACCWLLRGCHIGLQWDLFSARRVAKGKTRGNSLPSLTVVSVEKYTKEKWCHACLAQNRWWSTWESVQWHHQYAIDRLVILPLETSLTHSAAAFWVGLTHTHEEGTLHHI